MGEHITLAERAASKLHQLVPALRHHAEPLPDPDRAEEFGACFDRFADARVVLLGEATHGTSEFYRARAAITRRLIEHQGFSIVAVEGDWPDAARIDDYARHRAPRPRLGDPFVRFPTWMWRNAEVLAFADWLRGYNAQRAARDQASFHGLDIYSLGESIHAVLSYLDRTAPAMVAPARSRYACLSLWQEDPAGYGRAALHGRDTCEDGAVEQLRELLERARR